MPLHVNSPFTLALRNTEPLIDAKQTADPGSERRMYTQIKDTVQSIKKMDSFPLIIRKRELRYPYPENPKRCDVFPRNFQSLPSHAGH